MARVEIVPEPPTWLNISAAPDKTVKGAVDWYKRVGVDVTEGWIKKVTDRNELTCRIIAGKRYYSTEELWRFIVTRPSRTAGAARYTQQKGSETA